MSASLPEDPAHRRAAIEAAAQAFPPNNRHGVLGISVGPRTIDGEEAEEWALRLHVERKRREPDASIGSITYVVEDVRFDVIPDVQPLGVVTHRFGLESFDAEWSGLRPGARIRSHSPSGPPGGVAALVGPRGATAPTHLLTAGHLFARHADGAPVFAAANAFAPVEHVGALVENLLDDGPADIALVSLTPRGVQLGSTSRPRPLGGLAMPGRRTTVTAACPTLGDWTGAFAVDWVVPSRWYLYSRARGDFVVTNSLVAVGSFTQPGDSGCCLAGWGRPRPLVGSCIGAVGVRSLFQPIAPFATQLAKRAGFELAPWSPR